MRKVYETLDSDSEDEADVVIDKGMKSGSVSNLPKVPLISFFIQKHSSSVNCKR